MKKVLIVGISSLVGSNLAIYLRKHYRVIGTYHTHPPKLDGIVSMRFPIQERCPIAEFVKVIRPDAIIYCAAENDNLRCQKDPGAAVQVNAIAPSIFASAVNQLNQGRFLFMSTSKVFSGEKGKYHESDETIPLNTYGQTKVNAEGVLELYPNSFVLRLGSIFGVGSPFHRSLFNRYLASFWTKRDFPLISDEYRSFISVEEVSRAVGILLDTKSDKAGTYHLGASERHSHYSFAKAMALAFGFSSSHLKPVKAEEFSKTMTKDKEERGHDLTLSSTLFQKTFHFRFKSLGDSLTHLRIKLETGLQ